MLIIDVLVKAAVAEKVDGQDNGASMAFARVFSKFRWLPPHAADPRERYICVDASGTTCDSQGHAPASVAQTKPQA